MDKKITAFEAILAMYPDAIFTMKNDEIVAWDDRYTQPTKEQIEAKIKELEAQAVIDKKYADATSFIYKHYPQTKQNSDLADKLYYENVLKANGFENLEQTIVSKVIEFENGKSFDELLADVDDANKEAIAQLLKVGIRVTWVQRCKEELKKSIAEDREPNFPKYPLD